MWGRWTIFGRMHVDRGLLNRRLAREKGWWGEGMK
jgi:hypothetical protein